MNPINQVLIVFAVLGCGTVAGVFFAFSTFVMAGLARVPAAQGIAAMQSINVTAVRPGFMIGLFGTAALCVVLAVRALLNWGDRSAPLLLAASLLYLVGVVGLTIAYHVPLNNALAAIDPATTSAGGYWAGYLRSWTMANHVRTAASFAAAAVFVVTLIR